MYGKTPCSTKTTSFATNKSGVCPSDRNNAELVSRSCTPVLMRSTCGYPYRNMGSSGVISAMAEPANKVLVCIMLLLSVSREVATCSYYQYLS